uniref:Alkaline/neutral invertase n=1 Tax=Aegilops tauschii subsp. strangulata TaxID=200361 RepID=A0A453C014_AEGTS
EMEAAGAGAATPSHASMVDTDDFDLSRLLNHRPRINVERQRSFDDRSLGDLYLSAMDGRGAGGYMDSYESMYSPGGGLRSLTGTPASSTRLSFEPHPLVGDAWDALRRSLVCFRGQPLGTIAAVDSSSGEVLNYDQGWEKRIDRFKLGEGAMPASFKVLKDPKRGVDTLAADFGESAIGRVAPADSGFWWIILLRAYTKSTGDHTLAETPECQKGIRLIMNQCLAEGFDTFPTLLCADGCCMIDRRMGVYGYPIEIQALFFMSLRCALLLLKPEAEGNKDIMERIVTRLHALSYHMRTYFWLDFQQLNVIYRFKTEEYSHTAVNKFNVIPESIPDWLFDFMPSRGGYFVGNVSPARMDFRWFALGN